MRDDVCYRILLNNGTACTCRIYHYILYMEAKNCIQRIAVSLTLATVAIKATSTVLTQLLGTYAYTSTGRKWPVLNTE